MFIVVVFNDKSIIFLVGFLIWVYIFGKSLTQEEKNFKCSIQEMYISVIYNTQEVCDCFQNNFSFILEWALDWFRKTEIESKLQYLITAV